MSSTKDIRVKYVPRTLLAGLLGISLCVYALASPLIIRTQPKDAVVEPGASVTFRSVILGATGYQWQKDGQAIPGATSATLHITSVQPSDAGAYTLTALNGQCSATSTPAHLYVTPELAPPR